MSKKQANFIIAAFAGVGIALWYTPLKFLSIVWLWLLIGVPRQLATSAIEVETY
jgi:hypothetical protein